jgi:hypothetical protein
MPTKTCLLSYTFAHLVLLTSGDIYYENELIKPDEIFDTVQLLDSDTSWQAQNVTRYYCVFRGLWDKTRQPALFPDLARFSSPLIYSGNKQYIPWLKNRATTLGVEKYAEVRRAANQRMNA